MAGDHLLRQRLCGPQGRWHALRLGRFHERRQRCPGGNLSHGAVAHAVGALFPAKCRCAGDAHLQPDGAVPAAHGHPGRWPHLHDHQRHPPRRSEARRLHGLDLRQPGRTGHLPAHDQSHRRRGQRHPDLHPQGGEFAPAQPAAGRGCRLQHRLGHGICEWVCLCRPDGQWLHLCVGEFFGWRHWRADRNRLHPDHLKLDQLCRLELRRQHRCLG